MNDESLSIHIVDDDPSVRDALTVIFDIEGFDVEAFETGDSFMVRLDEGEPDCVVLDVHMPGKSGIEILRLLNGREFTKPVFVISGQGDIPMAVEAIKQGAHDFLEKPFDAETVVMRVRDAIAANRRNRSANGGPKVDFPGAEELTPREREVLEQITAGASNKEAGRTLGISPRTIEVHRARIMEKLGARNAADLVRIVLTGEPPEA
ncbi:response regulator transcription factor [Stappia sp. F7233]|uniref:Response regulator transcription factor n=1 Tax=Stappia albiluteola TaxID=2758565 RepID=A0A839AHF2_9HYPH|nr:response regulator [Stappia albiluteola]MBA5779133.1 response regulator transcription factor [Stappia albiluteola]